MLAMISELHCLNKMDCGLLMQLRTLGHQGDSDIFAQTLVNIGSVTPVRVEREILQYCKLGKLSFSQL